MEWLTADRMSAAGIETLKSQKVGAVLVADIYMWTWRKLTGHVLKMEARWKHFHILFCKGIGFNVKDTKLSFNEVIHPPPPKKKKKKCFQGYLDMLE